MYAKEMLNSKNWFENYTKRKILSNSLPFHGSVNYKSDKNLAISKKATMEALSLHINNFSSHTRQNYSYLFKDVDIVAYIFCAYLFQNTDILSDPDIIKHLNNFDKACFILDRGCVSNVAAYILQKHPQIVEDVKSSYNIIEKYSNSPEVIVLYENYLQDLSFVKQYLKKKKAFSTLLKYHPGNYDISIALIKQGLVPRNHTHLVYHPDIYKDIDVVKTALAAWQGESLYSSLPDYLQQDREICQIVLKHHPHAKVKNHGLHTLVDFENFINNGSNFSKELYTVLEKTKQSGIFNSLDDIVHLFHLINKYDMTCYVDLMGGPVFDAHPVQEFLLEKSKTIPDIKSFLESDIGQQIITFHVKQYAEFEEFERSVMPKIHSQLEKFAQYVKLEKRLNDNELIDETKSSEQKHKNKI